MTDLDLTDDDLRHLVARHCSCHAVDLARTDADHMSGCDLAICAVVREVVRRRSFAQKLDELAGRLSRFQSWGEGAGEAVRGVAYELRSVLRMFGAARKG
jgi:hypothetical protein